MTDEWCRRCSGENCVWAAPSPLWNKVMRGNDINGDTQFSDLVCMKCFVELADKLGMTGQWRLTLNPLPDDLVYETPSGRAWDWDTWLWTDREEESNARDRERCNGQHRGPEGPNEDIGQCSDCGGISYVRRPSNEQSGLHLDDCSLPIHHESYCVGGGAGHAPLEVVRGY